MSMQWLVRSPALVALLVTGLVAPDCGTGPQPQPREESGRAARSEGPVKVARLSNSAPQVAAAAARETNVSTDTPRPAEAFSVTIPWGPGEQAVGLRPTRPLPESVPEGPSAVAVSASGEVLVLDRLKGRVLRVDERGVQTVARVPRDAEDLTCGPEGVIGAFSPLRALVFLRALTSGTSLGEVAVPRELRLARGIVLGPLREVLVQNAHQETYRLGRPDAPLDLPAVLHSKREGEWLLGDGRGLAVRRHADGRAELLVIGRGPHAPVEWRHALPGPLLAARLLGLAGGVACLRLERAQADHGPRISIDREALCLGAEDGRLIFRRALPHPAASRYLPRRELALGGSPLRLAFMSPQVEGLRVEVWPLPQSPPRLAKGPGEVRP